MTDAWRYTNAFSLEEMAANRTMELLQIEGLYK